jgi:DNA invertase Pin-like site-specific DNA recombinase
MINKDLMRLMHKEIYEEKRECFESLGNGGLYTKAQKHYAFELIKEYGVRATARILKIPRRTLQRWCRKYGVWVRRCPSWVYEWAERRQKKRRFWQYRGYG